MEGPPGTGVVAKKGLDVLFLREWIGESVVDNSLLCKHARSFRNRQWLARGAVRFLQGFPIDAPGSPGLAPWLLSTSLQHGFRRRRRPNSP